jgi:hypothetical protein
MSEDTKIEGVKPEAKSDDPLSALSPEVRKIFEQTQAGLLSALTKEREARSEAQKKADAFEKAQQDAERKRLEETNDYKKLYEATLADVTKFKPIAEQVNAYEKTLGEILEAQIAELPEDYRDVVPDGLSTKQKLDWLAKNKIKFMKAEPFDIGAGKRGVKPDKSSQLTDDEKRMAKHLGMSEEDYAKFK